VASVTELARGADMLVCMCWDTDREMEEEGVSRGMTGARSAGLLAAEAGVGTLVLTHICPRLDSPDIREEGIGEAEAAFGGTVVFGEELMVLDVGGA
jgi:ribonuclease BN (tRNA processing enzyme)